MTNGREALRLLPDAADVLDALVAHSPLEPRLGGLVRATTARVHDLAPLPGADPTPPITAREHAITAFARQFATDVSAISDDQRAAFLAAAGDATFAIVQAIYVADFVPRVDAVLGALFGAAPGGGPAQAGDLTVVDAGTTWATIEEFLRVVHNHHGLDDVLSEVVRLRGAHSHDCRRCKTLRSRAALLAGATEATFEAADPDDRTRAALDLTDAIIWHPARIDDDLIGRARSQFTDAEIVELVLDVMRNAANKIAVALAADAPTVTEGVDVYEIDEAGVAHHGLTLS